MSKKSGTTKAKVKPIDKRKHKAREGKLLGELCAKHGYAFLDAPKGQRIVMTYLRNTPKARVEASIKIFLVVPSTSVLGEQFSKRYNAFANKGSAK